MENEYLIKHLASVDLSFLKVVKHKNDVLPVAPLEAKKETIAFFIDTVVSVTNENWNSEIQELETFFNSAMLPAQPVKLSHWSTITNVSLFIESHFATVKFNNGNRTYLPYLNRLQELKQMLTNANIN